MANPTALVIIGLARDLLRAESQSDVPVIGDSFMLSALSDGNLKWADAHGIGGESPLLLQRDTGFDLADETAINDTAGIAVTATTMTVDSTTGYGSSSAEAAVIWDDKMPDPFFYTAKTATTFTGVTNLGFAHEDNDVVQPLYKLPSNFESFRESPTHGDGVSLNGIPLKFTEGPPVTGYFSTITDGTNTFLWLPRGATGSASVWYNKVSATIDSVDDTVDVPEKYKKFLVWHLVAYAYAGREQDVGRYQFAIAESERVLQRALTNRNTGKKIRARSLGRIHRDYIPTSRGYVTVP